jgi:integrase
LLAQPAPLGSPTQSARPTIADGHTLQEIADKWVKERAPIKRTVGQAQKVIGRYVEHMGDTKVEQITRRNVVEFKDKLLESGQTAVNTNKQLMILSILLNFAVANSIIDQNPSKGIKVEVRKNAKEARLPFDLPALNAVFSSPLYALGERPKGGAGEAGYWLPLRALFTRARIEELCQLHPDDVYEETYRELDGSERSAWVLRITDEGPGQALKNPGSRRRIPIHAELIRLGFVEYVRKAKGWDRIFDELVKDVVGDESGNWSTWFGGYLREKAGVTDKRMVFLSFRHTFKHEARAMEIPEDVSDAITGHASGKVSRNYGGTDYPLRP